MQTFDEPFPGVGDRILGWLGEQKAQLAPTFAFLDPFGMKGLPIYGVAVIVS